MNQFAGWFSGKTALVTGATSGIGREIAKLITGYDCSDLVGGRDKGAMNSLLEGLEVDSSFPTNGFFVDFSDDESLRELIAKVQKDYEVDIPVNNTGFGDIEEFYLIVLGFTDALHQEMLSFNVHITGLYPGKTYTRFVERARGGKMKDWDKAMSPESIAELGLKGLSENEIRVIPGLSNKIKIFIASIMPISLLLSKTYSN